MGEYAQPDGNLITGCSAVGSAPALGAGCRRFESCHSDQTLEIIEISRVFFFSCGLPARLPLLNFLKEAGCAKMARKRIKMNASTMTLAEVFPRFLTSKTAQGVSEKTLKTYRWHFHCIGKHLDLGMSFDDLTREHLELLVVSMRRSGLSHNSISSYMRVMRTFLKWSKEQGYTTLEVPNIRDKETVKETYTDDELARLLKKPSNTCDFAEYRNWVIVNFLLNCGCRAATIRNIRNCDVDISAHQVFFRHTKTGKVQLIPLCSAMNSILADYMEVRGGGAEDYLFSNDFGEMMTENALRSAIYRYNCRTLLSISIIYPPRAVAINTTIMRLTS